MNTNINTGSNIILITAPITVVSILILAKPCVVINKFIPNTISTNMLPSTYILAYERAYGIVTLLAGSGGAPRAAIYMGKKDNATAEKIVGNCFTFLVICAVVLTAGFYGTLPVLLKWFGASSVTMPYK